MATQAISWGEDAHRSVIELLSWPDNSRLACCNRAFYNAKITCTTANRRASWGQAQSISRDVEDLVASLVGAAQVFTPSARPNWSMLMIDSDVLLTTTTRDLCGRLHAASLIPLECPIFVVKSASGVFGAGVGEEGNFSRYEGRDIELDPTAPVTAVLTVAYIPPEEGVDGRPGRPRVQSFIVDDSPQNRRRHSSKSDMNIVEPVLMECAPPIPAWSTLGCAAAAAGKFSPNEAPSSRSGGGTSADAGGTGSGSGGGRGGGSSMEESAKSESTGAIARVAVPEAHQSGHGGGGGSTMQKSVASAGAAVGADGGGEGDGDGDGAAKASDSGGAQPQRRSARLSTMANSRAAARSRAASPRVRPQLLPPSASVPLEQADTVLIVGQQPSILDNTTAWLELLLPEAVIIGGICGCALVIGDQVFPGDKLSRQPRRTHSPPLVVGVALRGVHAMAVSARGFQGMGPVFRVDNTVDRNRQAQALPGQFLREVTVFENGGSIRPGEHSALQVLCDELLEDRAGDANLMDDSSNIFLGVAPTAGELVDFRPSSGNDGAGEARGVPPIGVVMASGGIIGLDDDVTPGQYARFLRTNPQLVLDDTEAIYRSCKQRMEREGSAVLSSIHFTCSVRPDRVEQQRQRGADGKIAVEACVMALHQQEVVRFCKTLNAPAAGVFCDGELGPAATLVGGILPKTAQAVMQGYASCAAVLCWNPNSS